MSTVIKRGRPSGAETAYTHVIKAEVLIHVVAGSDETAVMKAQTHASVLNDRFKYLNVTVHPSTVKEVK